MNPGPRNLITDVAGLRVGNAEDHTIKSGTTVLVGGRPFRASVDVMGGSPGSRETDLLSPDKMVDRVDAIVLSGGSAFGLDAASGVTDGLRAEGRGFQVGPVTVPIVPGAILFDLLNGGDKAWGRFAPYRDLAYAAASRAGSDFALGSVGAGLGATTANFKGGLGSASAVTRDGVKVGAIVAVNAVGSVTLGDGPWFWAAPFERDGEYGGRGWPAAVTPDMLALRMKGGAAATENENTTIGVVVTDAVLTRSQTKRLAMIAQTGLARAIYPVHAPMDGDVLFSAATCEKPIDPLAGLTELGMVAANVMARAVARGVYEATALPFAGALPAWKATPRRPPSRCGRRPTARRSSGWWRPACSRAPCTRRSSSWTRRAAR